MEARLRHYRRFLLYHLAPFLLRASTRHRRILQVLHEPSPVRALMVHREFTRFMMASKDQPPSSKCESANAPPERSSHPALPGQTDEVLHRRDELLERQSIGSLEHSLTSPSSVTTAMPRSIRVSAPDRRPRNGR